MKQFIAVAALLLSGCAATGEPFLGTPTNFGPSPGKTTAFDTRPADTTKIAVKRKSYDEVWNASLAAVRRHLTIVEQNKDNGIIRAKQDGEASQNSVEVSISPSSNSESYTVEVRSPNPSFVPVASYTQKAAIAAEIKQALQNYGTVGLVSAQFDAPVQIEIVQWKGRGALNGAKRGAATGAKPGFEVMKAGAQANDPNLGSSLFMLGAGISAVGAAIGSLVGAVAGAFEGESDKTIREEEAQTKAILARLNVQEKARDGVEQYAKEHGGPAFVKLINEGPTSFDQEVVYQGLSAQNVDTVVEITVTSVGVKSDPYSDPDQPRPLIVFINARARLVQTKTNSVLDENSFVYQSQAKPYSEWSVNDGRPLADELTTGCQDIARQVSDSFY
ncbi:MAG TPA: hypothetical protein VEG25_04220 [Burkholderiales bacterium]|nr:hypothetical protein [Burkholderiales bacterium]